ncbi:MAG TPA: nitrilase-related carbon-nitrogen hydrolase, partial [Roseibacillus sp.]|nr:nitrilase-related carbon-nitrogen hydrolase [Roseibacillus sp.]
MNALRVASVQFQHQPGDKETNLAIVRSFAAQAAAEQVDLMVFPEMCITGYWHVRNLSREEIDALAEPVPDGPSTEVLLSLASEHGMTIGAG